MGSSWWWLRALCTTVTDVWCVGVPKSLWGSLKHVGLHLSQLPGLRVPALPCPSVFQGSYEASSSLIAVCVCARACMYDRASLLALAILESTL